jgi:hypothetical protein
VPRRESQCKRTFSSLAAGQQDPGVRAGQGSSSTGERLVPQALVLGLQVTEAEDELLFRERKQYRNRDGQW